MEKLQLNDASLTFEPESSAALGFGFRCGFLGMLHMEIIQERLEREFNMTVIMTVPNVSYIATLTKGGTKVVQDGPVAETRETLGGYFVIDVPDLDAALAWAEKCPAAEFGKVEIRASGMADL